MGFIVHFYIIFGTNPRPSANCCFFAYFSVSQQRNIKRNPNGMKPSGELFWNKRDLEDLEWTSRKQRGGHEAGRRAQGGRHSPHPRGPLVAPLTDFLRLYILIYPENIREHHETLFPPPRPSVPVRSHLGTFSAICRRGIRSRRASTSTP